MSRIPTPPSRCAHQAPVMVNPAVGGDGYLARCLECGTIGSVQKTTEKALQVLRDREATNLR